MRAHPVELICEADNLPMPEAEYRFDPPRRWRFDFAWPSTNGGAWDADVALEIEGAVWTRGRHTRGAGFLKDMEKYNRATVLGWKVIRCTPSTIHEGMKHVAELLRGD